MLYEIEDTFWIEGRGLIIAVNARNECQAGQKFDAIIRDEDGNEVSREVVAQEWMRRLRDDGTVESIAFVIPNAKKGSIHGGYKMELISKHEAR